MDDALRFTPRMVCSALGIPHGTLGSWAARGFMANFDAAFATQGKARQFTLKDALALALLRDAGGGEPSELSDFAPDAAEAWIEDRTRIRELKIFRSPTTTAFRFNDDVMSDPPPDDWVMAWSYNLAVIFGGAEKALLEALAKPDRKTAVRTMGDAAPLLPTINRVRVG